MCYYMGCRVPSVGHMIRLKQIEKELGLAEAMRILQSGFEYDDYPVIIPKGKADIEIKKMHWEFVPWWIKDDAALQDARKQGIPWLNAKGETLLSGKMFRDAALKRRCLVPVTHFFEWRHFKTEGAKKDASYPYAIEPTGDSQFFIAGIYQPWTNKSTGEIIDTFALVTTAANDLMLQVHNSKKRQPTIMDEEIGSRWIFDDLDEKQITELATWQLPATNMHVFTIAKDFRTAVNPLEPFIYDELPELKNVGQV